MMYGIKIMPQSVFKKIGLFAFCTLSLSFVLQAQNQDTRYFYLGRNYEPYRLNYGFLAQTIDLKFENLEDVEIASFKYPLRRRFFDVVKDDFIGIKLAFRANTKEDWKKVPRRSKIFRCSMNIIAESDQGLWIYDCNNFEGINLPDFSIPVSIEKNPLTFFFSYVRVKWPG